jgi:hypothetical protein
VTVTERRVLLDDNQWHAAGRTPIPAVDGEVVWPVTPTPWLPFDLIERESLITMDRKIWAHAFVTYPIGGDGRANNQSSFPGGWWADRMPGGTQNPTYGGELRDRMLDPFTRPRTEPNWWILDRAQEVVWARNTGMDGFTVDWLNLNDGSGDNRTGQVREYAEAVRYLGVQDDFKLILMPDGTTSICDGGNYAAFVAKTIDLLTTYPDVFYRDGAGRWVISPYYPEGAPNSKPGTTRITNTDPVATHTFWQNYKADLAAAGFNVALWMCYVRTWHSSATAAPATADLSVIVGRWGDRDPNTTGNSTNSNRGAAYYARAVYGRGWLAPCSNQDNRCNTSESPKAWEAGNTEQWRKSWYSAITPDSTYCADMVQIPTWSDFREHAHIAPSLHHGFLWCDLTSYFGQAYKTATVDEFGAVTVHWPPILRDGLYLTHRKHRTDIDLRPVAAGGDITGTQTQFMVQVGGTPWRNNIEVVAFLTSISDTVIEILVDGVVVETFTPTTGNREITGQNVYVVTTSLPHEATEISTRVRRGGLTVSGTDVATDFPVSDTQEAQTMHYVGAASLRAA